MVLLYCGEQDGFNRVDSSRRDHSNENYREKSYDYHVVLFVMFDYMLGGSV